MSRLAALCFLAAFALACDFEGLLKCVQVGSSLMFCAEVMLCTSGKFEKIIQSHGIQVLGVEVDGLFSHEFGLLTGCNADEYHRCFEMNTIEIFECIGTAGCIGLVDAVHINQFFPEIQTQDYFNENPDDLIDTPNYEQSLNNNPEDDILNHRENNELKGEKNDLHVEKNDLKVENNDLHFENNQLDSENKDLHVDKEEIQRENTDFNGQIPEDMALDTLRARLQDLAVAWNSLQGTENQEELEKIVQISKELENIEQEMTLILRKGFTKEVSSESQESVTEKKHIEEKTNERTNLSVFGRVDPNSVKTPDLGNKIYGDPYYLPFNDPNSQTTTETFATQDPSDTSKSFNNNEPLHQNKEEQSKDPGKIEKIEGFSQSNPTVSEDKKPEITETTEDISKEPSKENFSIPTQDKTKEVPSGIENTMQNSETHNNSNLELNNFTKSEPLSDKNQNLNVPELLSSKKEDFAEAVSRPESNQENRSSGKAETIQISTIDYTQTQSTVATNQPFQSSSGSIEPETKQLLNHPVSSTADHSSTPTQSSNFEPVKDAKAPEHAPNKETNNSINPDTIPEAELLETPASVPKTPVGEAPSHQSSQATSSPKDFLELPEQPREEIHPKASADSKTNPIENPSKPANPPEAGDNTSNPSKSSIANPEVSPSNQIKTQEDSEACSKDCEKMCERRSNMSCYSECLSNFCNSSSSWWSEYKQVIFTGFFLFLVVGVIYLFTQNKNMRVLIENGDYGIYSNISN